MTRAASLAVKLMGIAAGAVLLLAGLGAACNRADSPAGPSAQALSAAAAGPTFKVATWNIRSGKGIHGFTTTAWSHDTGNCTDRSQPLNAWGMGLPQAELAHVRADEAIVALAIQEAWFCGSPANVNGVIGFKSASQERNGVALLARYGFSGPVQYEQIEGGRESRWLVGGDVCLDAACSATVAIYSTHFGIADEDLLPAQAQRALDFLATRPVPNLFLGDLNVFRTDQWNPRVPCTADDLPARGRTLDLIEQAGYADAWKKTQAGEGWTGMASRHGCGTPEGNLYKRVDYVFSKGLTPLSTTRFARAEPGADAPSDHAGLIAEFAVPAR